MATNEQTRTSSQQLVVSTQSSSEDSMSVVYSNSSDDGSTTDAISGDLREHKVELKKIRDKNRCLMQLTGGPKGFELRDIQSRFHMAIYHYVKKIRRLIQLAQLVEMHVQAFIETEALVRGLESKTAGRVEYDKEKLLSDKRQLFYNYDRMRELVWELAEEKELRRVVDEMQNFSSMPSGYY